VAYASRAAEPGERTPHGCGDSGLGLAALGEGIVRAARRLQARLRRPPCNHEVALSCTAGRAFLAVGEGSGTLLALDRQTSVCLSHTQTVGISLLLWRRRYATATQIWHSHRLTLTLSRLTRTPASRLQIRHGMPPRGVDWPRLPHAGVRVAFTTEAVQVGSADWPRVRVRVRVGRPQVPHAARVVREGCAVWSAVPVGWRRLGRRRLRRLA